MQRTLAALAVVSALTASAVAAPAGDDMRALPMQFVLRHGATDTCEVNCRPWVSAIGMIKPETARDFEAFAGAHDLRGATIAFDSEGGSVLGAIALGRAIRGHDMTTTVGRPIVPPSGEARWAALAPRGDCDSMCAFVLLAGTQRIVPPRARVRVHQIWLGDRREDAMAANYSAEDLVLVQRDIGRLAQYTVEMSGSIELLEIALRIPPWEPMYMLTRQELRQVRLDMASSPVADAKPAPVVAVAGVGVSTSAVRSAAITGRGWGLIEKSGRPALARRHPLTLEGEDIGSFDLILVCGDSPDSFIVNYAETRRGRDARLAPEVLHEVQVSLGGRSASLAITASTARPPELDTFASGVVSARLVRNFVETANRSLTVTTANRDRVATSIRVGNSGIARNFQQFASACTKKSRRHSAGLVE